MPVRDAAKHPAKNSPKQWQTPMAAAVSAAGRAREIDRPLQAARPIRNWRFVIVADDADRGHVPRVARKTCPTI